MIRTITAIERDGTNVRTLSLSFEVPDKQFDLVAAIKKAATDYCKSKDGKDVFDYNCSCFNWADFHCHVPQSFCIKYGFKKIESSTSDIEVDWDEQLVNSTEIEDFYEENY